VARAAESSERLLDFPAGEKDWATCIAYLPTFAPCECAAA